MQVKTPHQLAIGDVVVCHGGRFAVTAAPRLSQSHQPEGYWPRDPVGPSDTVVVDTVCLTGRVEGYFHPGAHWAVQGNHRARFHIE
jgi:hypothetical protein